MSQIPLLIEAHTAQAEEADSHQPTAKPLLLDAAAATAAKARERRKSARVKSDSPAPPRTSAASRPESTKANLVMKKLRLSRGATVAQIMEATGWQAHSVRGFFSAVVKKRLGFNLASEVGKDGLRRYRVVESPSRDVGDAR